MAYRPPVAVFGNVGSRPDWSATALSVTGSNTYNSTIPAQGGVTTQHVLDATGNAPMFSYQIGVVSGTPTGTFNVYTSNDPRATEPALFSSAIWTLVQTVSFTNGTTAAGNANASVVVQNGMRYSYASWVNTASSGTILGFAATIGAAGA